MNIKTKYQNKIALLPIKLAKIKQKLIMSVLGKGIGIWIIIHS